MNNEGTTLTSRVNGVDVVVNPSMLTRIYGIQKFGLEYYHTYKEISVEGVDFDEKMKKFTAKEEISKKLLDASKEVDEEKDQSHLKKPTRRTRASTSVEIIALLEEMRTNIRTLKANQPIVASQPPPQTPTSSSTDISKKLMEYLNEMGADIDIIKVRVDIVQ
ncbi:hypothetical protein Q3G72_014006 [Acer saccharum]|nr:hypothetical protein Q3G72_014006 [Acer saccharum]